MTPHGYVKRYMYQAGETERVTAKESGNKRKRDDCPISADSVWNAWNVMAIWESNDDDSDNESHSSKHCQQIG